GPPRFRGLAVGGAELPHLTRELAEGDLERDDDGDVGAAELSDLRGIDVEGDALRARRERGELPGDAVVEAGSDRDEEVALVHGPVRPLGTVHAGRSVGERMRVREGALGHEGGDDGTAAGF